MDFTVDYGRTDESYLFNSIKMTILLNGIIWGLDKSDIIKFEPDNILQKQQISIIFLTYKAPLQSGIAL